jgi:hypothetical protein
VDKAAKRKLRRTIDSLAKNQSKAFLRDIYGGQIEVWVIDRDRRFMEFYGPGNGQQSRIDLDYIAELRPLPPLK